MRLSLAPIKYRNILRDKHSPIERLSVREKEIRHGENGYEAYVYLKKDLIPDYSGDDCKIYGNCHGTGCSKYKNEATYIAISEALERFSFYKLVNSSDAKSYGFDVDASTTGLAALPCFIKSQTRKIAFFEAVERWTLKMWWVGRLPALERNYHNKLEFQALELATPFYGMSVAVIWRYIPSANRYAYGFACAKDFFHASYKAEIEQIRNEKILIQYFKNEGNKEDISKLNIQEKRLLYFSSKGGHDDFLKNREISKNIKAIPPKPAVIVDREVIGEWTRYVCIWRVLFDIEYFNDIEKEDIFYF